MFQNFPLPVIHEICESSSDVTPCIVMKNDGVLYQLVQSFSPEHCMKVVLQGCTLVGNIYTIMNITFTAHCVGRTSLDEENQDASIHLIGVSILVHMSEPRFRP